MKVAYTQGARANLIGYLAKGGVIVPDDSGAGWVCASRSGGCWQNELIDRLKERGWTHDGEDYCLAERPGEPGKWSAKDAPDGAPSLPAPQGAS